MVWYNRSKDIYKTGDDFVIALWCRTCNNQIKVDDDVTKVVCPYCSKAINVSELLGEEKEPVREMPADTGKNLKSEETPPPDTGKNYKNDGEAEVTSPPKKNIIKPIAIVLAIIFRSKQRPGARCKVLRR